MDNSHILNLDNLFASENNTATSQLRNNLTIICEEIHKLMNVENFVSATLPYELTSKERYLLHKYVEEFCPGFHTTNIILKGSANKKILFNKNENNIENISPSKRIPNDEELKIFINYARLPIAIVSIEHIDYFVDLYDQLYDTRKQWNVFLEEIQYMNMKHEFDKTLKEITSFIGNNKQYKNMMSNMVKGHKGERMNRDVYNISGAGKFYLSIDIKSANFTVLQKQCDSIFINSNGDIINWYEFVKQFTKSEFIAKSKQFREICFGNLGFCGRSKVLQEHFMEVVHLKILNWCKTSGNTFTTKMKSGDEIVYELHKDYTYDKFLTIYDLLKNELEDSINSIESIISAKSINTEKSSIKQINISDYLHFRVFKVEQICQKNYFLKLFTFNTDWNWIDADNVPSKEYMSIINDESICTDNRPLLGSLKSIIEFKCVPKLFFAQIAKWYFKQDIEDRDLLFTHEGIIAKFMNTIFD